VLLAAHNTRNVKIVKVQLEDIMISEKKFEVVYNVSRFKYMLSTVGVSKKSIRKFLIGNQFHVKLRIVSPYSNRMRAPQNMSP